MTSVKFLSTLLPFICIFSLEAKATSPCPFTDKESIKEKIKKTVGAIDRFQTAFEDSPACKIQGSAQDWSKVVMDRLKPVSTIQTTGNAGNTTISISQQEVSDFGCNYELVRNLDIYANQPADALSGTPFSDCIISATSSSGSSKLDHICMQRVAAAEKAKCRGAADVQTSELDLDNGITFMQDLAQIATRPECRDKFGTSFNKNIFDAIAGHFAIGAALYPGVGIAMIAPVLKNLLFSSTDPHSALKFLQHKQELNNIKCMIYATQQDYCQNVDLSKALSSDLSIPEMPTSLTCTQDEVLGTNSTILDLANNGIDAVFKKESNPSDIYDIVKNIADSDFIDRIQVVKNKVLDPDFDINTIRNPASRALLAKKMDNLYALSDVKDGKSRFSNSMLVLENLVNAYKNAKGRNTRRLRNELKSILNNQLLDNGASALNKADIVNLLSAYRAIKKDELSGTQLGSYLDRLVSFEAKLDSMAALKDSYQNLGSNLKSTSEILAALNQESSDILKSDFSRMVDQINQKKSSFSSSKEISNDQKVLFMTDINKLYNHCKLLMGAYSVSEDDTFEKQVLNMDFSSDYSRSHSVYRDCNKRFPKCFNFNTQPKDHSKSSQFTNNLSFVCKNIAAPNEGFKPGANGKVVGPVCGQDFKSFID